MARTTESGVTMHSVRHGQRTLRRRGNGALHHDAQYERIRSDRRTVNTAFRFLPVHHVGMKTITSLSIAVARE
jgi:hypothetical protein